MAIPKPNDWPDATDLFRDAPVRTILTVIAGVNWFVFFNLTIYLGGDAIGTTPSQQGFIVTTHGRETAVTEGVWLFSLYYPLATLTLSPFVVFLLALSQLFRLKSLRGYFFWIFVFWIFVLTFATGWYYTVIRDASHSILDYLNMNAR